MQMPNDEEGKQKNECCFLQNHNMCEYASNKIYDMCLFDSVDFKRDPHYVFQPLFDSMGAQVFLFDTTATYSHQLVEHHEKEDSPVRIET